MTRHNQFVLEAKHLLKIMHKYEKNCYFKGFLDAFLKKKLVCMERDRWAALYLNCF